MRKVAVGVIVAVLLLLIALVAMVGSAVAEYPWLAHSMPGAVADGAVSTSGITTIDVNNLPPIDRWPTIAPGNVPSDQWPLILSAALTSSCGVTPQDLAAIAQTESNFGKNLLNPISGAFGYGQFDAATWATFGSGNPNNPADALPAIARTLCARGYAQNRTAALNSYGGCLTVNCLGTSTYSDAINQLASTLVVTSPVVANARTWLGVPYLFGGCMRAGVDCSCLVMLIYQSVGVSLPRTAQEQWNATPRVNQSSLQPGDLVFFQNTYPSVDRITHVGLYEGNGLMVNAPDTGSVVQEVPVFSGFWGAHYAGAGRPGR